VGSDEEHRRAGQAEGQADDAATEAVSRFVVSSMRLVRTGLSTGDDVLPSMEGAWTAPEEEEVVTEILPIRPTRPARETSRQETRIGSLEARLTTVRSPGGDRPPPNRSTAADLVRDLSDDGTSSW